MKSQLFRIITAQSNIDWLGRKITGSHNGTIALKQGSLTLADGQLSAGRFTVDTRSIKILDVTDPATNAQFAGHLASDDFFASEQYPEATFEITAVNDNHVEGDLTIKGITKPLGFDVSVSVNGDTLKATGKIVVDRTKFDMKFRSRRFFRNLGDTLIYDDFDLNVTLTAKAVA